MSHGCSKHKTKLQAEQYFSQQQTAIQQSKLLHFFLNNYSRKHIMARDNNHANQGQSKHLWHMISGFYQLNCAVP